MSFEQDLITRREAILRVSALLGGVTFVGGSALLTACERERPATTAGANIGTFTPEDIAFLDEVAETILPETKTPGAKAAKTGAFIALMVTDSYNARDQKIFRDGMRKLDEASRKANNASFMSATPQQRLSLLESLDREQKAVSDARERAARRARGLADIPAEAKAGEAHLPDQRREAALGTDVGAATAITADSPHHYFRMMKELALLGYFTSEIGCTQAQRYIESPGRFDPCVPYTPGEKAWAPHA
ncbi:MAG: gluconate 2-dehydrogenase subunit 3 family protein [Gemmatimonadota bacterium]|nr:gluconate 2-dehydrogenase subunit 3 family protein [Gemmatimonadota bacterium]